MTLSARDRRTLAAGGAVIGSLVLVARGVPAYHAWIHDARVGAEEQVRVAAAADALLAGARVSRDTLAARNARYLALAPALVPGATPAEASASLASLISAAATNAGVTLGAVQLRPPVDTGARRVFVRVGVHADFVGDIRGLSSMLLGLEGGPIRLRVRELTVAASDPASSSDRVEVVRGDLVIDGLALPHTAPATPGRTQ